MPLPRAGTSCSIPCLARPTQSKREVVAGSAGTPQGTNPTSVCRRLDSLTTNGPALLKRLSVEDLELLSRNLEDGLLSLACDESGVGNGRARLQNHALLVLDVNEHRGHPGAAFGDAGELPVV